VTDRHVKITVIVRVDAERAERCGELRVSSPGSARQVPLHLLWPRAHRAQRSCAPVPRLHSE